MCELCVKRAMVEARDGRSTHARASMQVMARIKLSSWAAYQRAVWS